jgi:hypothetical protein
MFIKSKLIIVITLITLLISCDFNKSKLTYNKILDSNKEYIVVLMAGQSNMIGLGDVKDLDNPNLPTNISYFNYSADSQLKELPYNFGPEVGIAKRLNTEFPQLNFIFIKYAIGDSSINEWLPNVESKITRHVDFGDIYGEFLKMTDSITAKYKTQNLAFLWMQGETDAKFKNTSKTYESNFRKLIENIRKDFDDSNLPILFGKVNTNRDDFKYVSNIQRAQRNIEKSTPNTYLIDTNTIEKQKDSLHYSSLGLLNLGKDYGDILRTIIKENIKTQ